MIGLDTNILVRYLTRDDQIQFKRASSFIQENSRKGVLFFINIVVLCELVWVLESAYELKRSDIADTLQKILSTDAFKVDQSDIVWQAVFDYRSSGADFADHIIGRLNRQAGASHTITFDRTAAKGPGFDLL